MSQGLFEEGAGCFFFFLFTLLLIAKLPKISTRKKARWLIAPTFGEPNNPCEFELGELLLWEAADKKNACL